MLRLEKIHHENNFSVYVILDTKMDTGINLVCLTIRKISYKQIS